MHPSRVQKLKSHTVTVLQQMTTTTGTRVLRDRCRRRCQLARKLNLTKVHLCTHLDVHLRAQYKIKGAHTSSHRYIYGTCKLTKIRSSLHLCGGSSGSVESFALSRTEFAACCLPSPCPVSIHNLIPSNLRAL